MKRHRAGGLCTPRRRVRHTEWTTIHEKSDVTFLRGTAPDRKYAIYDCCQCWIRPTAFHLHDAEEAFWHLVAHRMLGDEVPERTLRGLAFEAEHGFEAAEEPTNLRTERTEQALHALHAINHQAGSGLSYGRHGGGASAFTMVGKGERVQAEGIDEDDALLCLLAVLVRLSPEPARSAYARAGTALGEAWLAAHSHRRKGDAP